MTSKEYQQMTLKVAKTKLFRTTQELSNGYARVPAGTLCRVTAKINGFEIEADQCPCCKIRLRVTKVPGGCLEVVMDVPDGWRPTQTFLE